VLFVFPGQGSQYVGMGSDLADAFDAARDVYDRACNVVGYDMRELSFRDPDGKLDKTRYTQPALLTHEVACLAALRSECGIQPAVAAGHSLGEYAALVAAGSLSFEAALALVAERGRLMSELGSGSMLATTLGLEDATTLANKHYCGIGGSNLPEQTVVAGRDADLERLAADLGETFPGKRAIKLNTEGAFHTYLMVNAALEFRPTLEETDFGGLDVDVLSNYTGAPHVNDAGAIRSRLFFQLFNPVRWMACMERTIEAGVTTIVEIGGGIGKGEGPDGKRPNLESIVKKTLKWRAHEAQYLPAINADAIRAAAQALSGN
jgi:[acyl-carrier-protein] S-malonyltransferase